MNRCQGVLLLALLGLLAPGSVTRADEKPRPTLAVVLVFDQLRGDFPVRWQKLFGKGGFRRLQREGAWFTDCHYPYGCTITAAGHASVVTGCSPNKHGIVGNAWYDRGEGKSVYCVRSSRYRLVNDRGPQRESGGAAPVRLLQPTLGDVLARVSVGKSKVVSLSLKDRAAILSAGRKPHTVYWMDRSNGRFITSTFYRDRPHPWVTEYNRSGAANRWHGKKWTRLRPDLDYTRHSGPDKMAGEGNGSSQGQAFPHPMGKEEMSPGRSYYKALYNSPFGNDLLVGLAKKAIEAEKLGQRNQPDLLCVSFSSNDVVGHCWGPDSQEVLDITLRTDRLLADLLTFLDQKVGKGRYVMAVTADHGICPIPEVARKQGKDAARVSPGLLLAKMSTFLDKEFEIKRKQGVQWITDVSGFWVYLNQSLLRKHGLKSSAVEKALATWVVKQKGVHSAYTRTQLLAGVPIKDKLGHRMQQAFHPQRCGDLAVVNKPYYLFTTYLTGTTHGSPHDYDTHVPLMILGPGVRVGIRKERVTPLMTAAVLAQVLGVPVPAGADAKVPKGLLGK